MATYGDPPPNIHYSNGAYIYTYTTNSNGTYPSGKVYPAFQYYPSNTPSSPVPDDVVVPILADATTTKAALQKHLDVLESLEDGVEGKMGEHLSDAIYFLRESMNALEHIIKSD